MFAFELGMIARAGFHSKIKCGRGGNGSPLACTRHEKGHEKGNTIIINTAVLVLAEGAGDQGNGVTSNLSWKCLIRASPSFFRQSNDFGLGYGETDLAFLQEARRERRPDKQKQL